MWLHGAMTKECMICSIAATRDCIGGHAQYKMPHVEKRVKGCEYEWEYEWEYERDYWSMAPGRRRSGKQLALTGAFRSMKGIQHRRRYPGRAQMRAPHHGLQKGLLQDSQTRLRRGSESEGVEEELESSEEGEWGNQDLLLGSSQHSESSDSSGGSEDWEEWREEDDGADCSAGDAAGHAGLELSQRHEEGGSSMHSLLQQRQNQLLAKYGSQGPGGQRQRPWSQAGAASAPGAIGGGDSAEALRMELSRAIFSSPDFWKGPQARMQSLVSMSGDRKGYIGAPMTTATCPDLEVYYQLKAASAANQTSSSAFAQLRSTVGQLVRFSVATIEVRVTDFCKAGAIWALLENRELIQLFLTSVAAEMRASTTRTKSVHIACLIDVAMTVRRSEGLAAADGRLQLVKILVHTFMGSMRRMAAPIARRAQIPDVRAAAGAEVTVGDLREVQDFVLSELESIYRSLVVDGMNEERVRGSVKHKLLNESGISNTLCLKWTINFTVAIVLFSGGQRTQVHSAFLAEITAIAGGRKMVANSSGPLMEEVVRRAEEDNIFFLSCAVEKRVRSTRAPFVAIDARLLKFVRLHVSHIRPVIMGAAPDPSPHSALLLHSKNGNTLSSSCIRSSLKHFFRRYDSELQHISPSILRRAYATNAMDLHREGKVCPEMTEEQFAGVVALAINSSAREVLGTYAAGPRDDAAVGGIVELHRAMS